MPAQAASSVGAVCGNWPPEITSLLLGLSRGQPSDIRYSDIGCDSTRSTSRKASTLSIIRPRFSLNFSWSPSVQYQKARHWIMYQ